MGWKSQWESLLQITVQVIVNHLNLLVNTIQLFIILLHEYNLNSFPNPHTVLYRCDTNA